MARLFAPDGGSLLSTWQRLEAIPWGEHNRQQRAQAELQTGRRVARQQSGSNPFPAVPQAPNETNAEYFARRLAMLPLNAAGPIIGYLNDNNPANAGASLADFLGREIPRFGRELTSTPRSRQTQNQSAADGNNFPNSFRDPAYDKADEAAAAATGVPLELLRSIRLNGERSNNDQVSSAGARTPYQFIPQTAAAIKQKYKLDVFASPQNAALGAALLLKEGAERNGGDFNLAVREYHGGTNRANWGPQNEAYISRVAGIPFQTGYDPSFDQASLGALAAGQAAALTPQTNDLGPAPQAPEAPAPILPAKTDFSAADASLQKLRPEEITEKERIKLQWNGWFSGLGQALAALPDDANAGKVLAALGGGALAGRASADREILAREDAFKEKLAKFNLAVFQQDQLKAKTAAEEAQFEASLLNQRAYANWQQQIRDFNENNKVAFTNDAILTSRVDGKGHVITKRIPLAGVVNSAFALDRARLLSNIGQSVNTGNRLVAQAQNALLVNEAAAQGKDNPEGLLTAPLYVAQSVVSNGMVPEVFSSAGIGSDKIEALQKEITQELFAAGYRNPSSSDYTEAFQKRLTLKLYNLAMSPGGEKIKEALFNAGTVSQNFDAIERYRGRRETTSVGRKGVNNSVTYSGE